MNQMSIAAAVRCAAQKGHFRIVDLLLNNPRVNEVAMNGVQVSQPPVHQQQQEEDFDVDNEFNNGELENIPEPQIQKIQDEKADENTPEQVVCGICIERKRNFVFQCGHMFCGTCCSSFDGTCPNCRKKIVTRTRLYF